MQSDAELLRRWRDGEVEAGRVLFRRHYESVARFFRNKAGEQAPDLVQRTFLGCIEGLERLEDEKKFRNFLFGVAYRQLCKHYEQQSADKRRFEVGTISVHDLDPTPSALLVRDQEQRILLEGLRRIPIEHQVALELHYWEKMEVKRIAEVLGLPLGTMKSRLRRARQLLRERLTELADSPEVLDTTLANLEEWARALRDQILEPSEST